MNGSRPTRASSGRLWSRSFISSLPLMRGQPSPRWLTEPGGAPTLAAARMARASTGRRSSGSRRIEPTLTRIDTPDLGVSLIAALTHKSAGVRASGRERKRQRQAERRVVVAARAGGRPERDGQRERDEDQ